MGRVFALLGLGVLVFLVSLYLATIFHELGHYVAARYFGVGVEALSIGFGPRIFETTFYEARVTFQLFPGEGYVFPKESLATLPRMEAVLVAAAGALTNLFLAFFFLSSLALRKKKVPWWGWVVLGAMFLDILNLMPMEGSDGQAILDLLADSFSAPVAGIVFIILFWALWLALGAYVLVRKGGKKERKGLGS